MNIKRYIKWIAVLGGALVILAVSIFFLVYNRYLYHLPAGAAENIPSRVSIENPRYNKAIIQGQKLIRKLMIDWELPSMSVAVGKGEELVWVEAFGYADPESKTPAHPGIPYRIHSISKPLTAMVIAHLYETGQIDLNISIESAYPDFPKKQYSFSLRDLLCHQAGIRHYTHDREVINAQHFHSIKESLSVFENDELLFEPGTSVHYSSFGYNLIGAIAERTFGISYGSLMDSLLFHPLGMIHSSLDTGSSRDYPLPKYYELDQEGKLYEAPHIDMSIKYPSGGIVSTPEDLIKFGLALLNHQYLKDTTLHRFMKVQTTSDGTMTGYGLGWEMSGELKSWKKWTGQVSGWFGWHIPHTVGFTPMVYHMGGSMGGMAMLVLYPEYKLVFAFVTNINGNLPPIYKMPMMALEGFFTKEIQ